MRLSPLQGSVRGSIYGFYRSTYYKGSVLAGSWDLVSTVIVTHTGVITDYKYSYVIYNPPC